jgi:hypothetical protein
LYKRLFVYSPTFFDCEKSYLKVSDDSLFVLQHEQIHFSLSEHYARKFIRLLQEQVDSFLTFEAKHAQLYHQILNELQLMQDKYDHEVYEDLNLQTAWQQSIQEQLRVCENLAVKEITIPFRTKTKKVN